MTDIFNNPFILRGFISSLVLAILAPSIGIFLLARRYTVIADALAHFTLVGVAIAQILHWPTPVVAPLVAVIAALGMERVRLSKKLFGDAALAVFLTGGLALALILSASSGSSQVNFNAYLFGSLASVSWNDIYLMIAACVLSLGLITVLYPYFFLLSLDEDLARAAGLHVTALSLVLILITASAVSSLITAVGALLVGGLMVIPPSAAAQFGLSFKRTLYLSILFGLISSIGGFALAYTLNLPGGATIVLFSLILLVISFLLNRND
ncbi:MAG TPA: metal ABC transporter permease [Patescibacteria group bacterium]|nr:metal ABC transporter permease [Patescibacteria group bacterium]